MHVTHMTFRYGAKGSASEERKRGRGGGGGGNKEIVNEDGIL